jgi:hypothetical protein
MTRRSARGVALVLVEKKVLPGSPLAPHVQSVLGTRTAGEPDDAKRLFTALSPPILSGPLANMGTPVWAEVSRPWREAPALRVRTSAQDRAGGHLLARETPCERMAALLADDAQAGHPACAIAPKAQEHGGPLLRAGRGRSTPAFRAGEPAVPRGAAGVRIPHGIDDRVRHRGQSNLGVSHAPSQWAGDRFRWEWNRRGKRW